MAVTTKVAHYAMANNQSCCLHTQQLQERSGNILEWRTG